jgi:hypothetical protein
LNGNDNQYIYKNTGHGSENFASPEKLAADMTIINEFYDKN